MCFHPTTRSLGLLYEFPLAFSVLVFAKTAVDDDGEDIEYPYTITSIETRAQRSKWSRLYWIRVGSKYLQIRSGCGSVTRTSAFQVTHTMFAHLVVLFASPF